MGLIAINIYSLLLTPVVELQAAMYVGLLLTPFVVELQAGGCATVRPLPPFDMINNCIVLYYYRPTWAL